MAGGVSVRDVDVSMFPTRDAATAAIDTPDPGNLDTEVEFPS